MRVLIQRVCEANVAIEAEIKSSIGEGLLVFVGIENADTHDDVLWISGKLANMRLFDDSCGVMNLSVLDIGAEVLIISQFTLHAGTKKGNRPSYIKAAKPDVAIPIYEDFISSVQCILGKSVSSGVFGADMRVSLINNGPVTIWVDSKNRE